MLYDDFKKELDKQGIGIVADGIGNTDIHYILKTGDGRREIHITLGGYCDMEPFKWSVETEWKVAKNTKTYHCQPWDIVSVKGEYVDSEFGGGHYDIDTKTYLADEEYLKQIIAAKDKLLSILPELTETSKAIFDDVMKDIFSLSIKKNYLSKKWIGHLTYKGVMKHTKGCASFFEAKEELDKLYTEAYATDHS